MGWAERLRVVIEELREKSILYYKDNLISLVLFGSVAKGLATEASDIDILYVLDSKGSSYETYSEYFDNIEEGLESIKEMRREGTHLLISPIFKTKEELDPRLPWLWKGCYEILFDRNDYFKRFLGELEKFEERHLVYHKKPLPYFEVIHGE